MFRSSDRGDSWDIISPDLTRQLDPYQLPIMGKVWPRDSVAFHAGTSDYGNISTISESPLRKGLLAVGTDDGLIQITKDDGATWNKIEKFPGVPERTWVTRVFLSNHDEATVYATFDGHRDNDFRPFITKSTDLGTSWETIAGNMPEFGSVKVLIEHPRNPNLLFVGTEFGVFVSFSSGHQWVELRNNLPTMMVRDMTIHPRENDLILASHARGFWILDDIRILEELTPEVLSRDVHLSPIRSATQFHRHTRGLGSSGTNFFTAPNPPDGAVITYYMNPDSQDDPQKARIEIVDKEGNLIRKLEPAGGNNNVGIQRAVWDLRYAPPYETDEEPSPFRRVPKGPFVLPGEYEVRLTAGDSSLTQPAKVEGDPLIEISSEDRRSWHDTLLALSQMGAAVQDALYTADQIKEGMSRVDKALETNSDAPDSLVQSAQAISKDLGAIVANIRGGGDRPDAQQPGVLPLAQLIRQLHLSIEGSTALPTADQRRLTARCRERLDEQLENLNRLTHEDLPALNEELSRLGISWTPGRAIRVQ
jgi:hypothetical protein